MSLQSAVPVEPLYQPLLDKVALISGSSRGIGLAIAEEMARQGAIVVLSSRRESSLIAAQDAIRTAGGRADYVVAHFGEAGDIGAAVSAVAERYARIDILVNNVSALPPQVPIVDLDMDQWSTVLSHNLTNYFYTSKLVARHMLRARSGKIINISSTSGSRPVQNMGAYSVVKAAINMLTEVLAVELEPFAINVNGIAPGHIKPTQHVTHDPHGRLVANPAQRFGFGDDVATLAAFLASDAARHITGQIISVDGGHTKRSDVLARDKG